MDTCSLDNNTVINVEEQVSFLFKVIILLGIVIIAAVCILLKKYFKTCGHIMTSIEECAKVRGVLVISSEFPSLPVQQKSTDKGEFVY